MSLLFAVIRWMSTFLGCSCRSGFFLKSPVNVSTCGQSFGCKKSSMLNYTEATFPHFQNQNIQREKRTQGQTAPINPLMMAKDAASEDSMALARPECAGLLSRSGYVRSGLHGWPSPRHKDPLHILLYPGHCGDPAPSRHTTPLAAPQLNASPVTGVGGGQCQFSCWKTSGAAAGLPISLSKGLR